MCWFLRRFWQIRMTADILYLNLWLHWIFLQEVPGKLLKVDQWIDTYLWHLDYIVTLLSRNQLCQFLHNNVSLRTLQITIFNLHVLICISLIFREDEFFHIFQFFFYEWPRRTSPSSLIILIYLPRIIIIKTAISIITITNLGNQMNGWSSRQARD